MSLWLTADELIELTGYRQRAKQRMALAKMGIPFQSRLDGFLLVLRASFIQSEKISYPAGQRRREPKFSVIQ